MLRGSSPLLVAATAVLLLLAAPAQGADFVGLGDSYSSGTGTAGSYPDNCQRTTAAYPTLLDAQFAGSGVNLSCSGGRTQHITTDAQTPGNAVPQLQVPGAVNASTDWITLQIGGNDAGFVDTLVECGNPFGDCGAAIEEAEQTAMTELPPKLNATYDAVRAAAPNATIAVVGYPRIFRPNQSCNTFFSSGEVNDLNGAADLLSDSIKALAQARSIAYIDPRPAFIGHGACDSVEWINGLSATFENSYHPKAVGHSSGYGPLVLAGVNAIPNTDITSAPAAQSNTSSPQFQFSSAPAAAGFQCRIDSGAYSACSSPKQFSDLGEGSHTVQVRGVNTAGNVDQFPDSHTWTVDTVAPSLTLNPGGPTGTVATDAAAFTFAADSGTLSCRLDAGSFGACQSPGTHSYADLGDGPHTFTVRATDAAGNATSASRAWTVDTTAPLATVNTGPGNPTASPEAQLVFSVDDPAATPECRLDSDDEEDFDPCASPVNLPALSDGPHVFEVRARDAVGNVGPVSTYEWTIDVDAPAIAVTSGPPALTNQDSAGLAFESEPGATFLCSLDGAEPASCTSPASYDELDDGEHTFTVQATDTALNVATDTHSWVVDTTAPGAAVDDGPPSLTGDTSAQIAFSSEDAGATFECRLDSAAEEDFDPCASPHALAGLSDASHTFELRAVDEAGNAGPPASHAWTVDTTGPTPTIQAGPSAPTAVSTAQFEFASSEPGSSFECRIDSTDPDAFQPCSSPQPHSGLQDGPHTFDVRATDAVGNLGSVASRSWSVDTTPPTVAFDSGPAQIVPVGTADFTFHASEPGSSFQCRIDSGQPGDFIACTSPRAYEDLADGPHTLEVRAADALSNQGPVTAYSWNADTVIPTATITSGPENGDELSSDDASFAFSASEPGDFACRIDGGPGVPFEICDSPHAYSDLEEGEHEFELRFTDAGGHTVTDSRTWTVDTVAPVVTLSGGPTGTVASAVASIGFAVDAGGPAQCSWDSEAFAPCGASPASRSGLGDGEHELRIRSTDAAGNTGSAARTWRVDRTAPQTSIDSGPAATVTSGDASFAFSADDGSTNFQCSLDGSLFETCASPRSYAGLGLGDHTFRVRAIDAIGNVDTTPAAMTWRVEQPPSGAVQGTVKKKPKCSKKKGKKRKGGRKCKRRR